MPEHTFVCVDKWTKGTPKSHFKTPKKEGECFVGHTSAHLDL